MHRHARSTTIPVPAADHETATARSRADRILRLPAVTSRVGAGRSTVYSWMEKGLFPRPIVLGPRMVGWREGDIDRWIADRRPRVED